MTFFLATNPAKKLQGQVDEIEPQRRGPRRRGQHGAGPRVVRSDRCSARRFADPKIGAGATAKIHCGKRSIGYVWLHDLVDFVRAKILFRL